MHFPHFSHNSHFGAVSHPEQMFWEQECSVVSPSSKSELSESLGAFLRRRSRMRFAAPLSSLSDSLEHTSATLSFWALRFLGCFFLSFPSAFRVLFLRFVSAPVCFCTEIDKAFLGMRLNVELSSLSDSLEQTKTDFLLQDFLVVALFSSAFRFLCLSPAFGRFCLEFETSESYFDSSEMKSLHDLRLDVFACFRASRGRFCACGSCAASVGFLNRLDFLSSGSLSRVGNRFGCFRLSAFLVFRTLLCGC